MKKAYALTELRLMAVRPMRIVAGVLLAASLLSGCSDGTHFKFPTSKWGAASPRVTTSSNVPKGGGRAMVGKPYQVAGRWYTPRIDTDYDKTGKASWYGADFHGRLTANGEIFDQNALTAAHPTLPLPSYVRVTNLENHRSIIVRVNDRGPFVANRLIDLSRRSADLLGLINHGVASVRVQYVGPAPLEGDDTRILLASLDTHSPLESGAVRLASSDTTPLPAPARVASTDTPVPASTSQPERVLGTLKTLFTSPLDLFGYADGATEANPVNAAFAATEAVATGVDLAAWQKSVDVDQRRISLDLGDFADPLRADRVARAFALIAAVETKTVPLAGGEAVRIHLSWLKPGATRADVISLAEKLGLEDVAFPD